MAAAPHAAVPEATTTPPTTSTEFDSLAGLAATLAELKKRAENTANPRDKFKTLFQQLDIYIKIMEMRITELKAMDLAMLKSTVEGQNAIAKILNPKTRMIMTKTLAAHSDEPRKKLLESIAEINSRKEQAIKDKETCNIDITKCSEEVFADRLIQINLIVKCLDAYSNVDNVLFLNATGQLDELHKGIDLIMRTQREDQKTEEEIRSSFLSLSATVGGTSLAGLASPPAPSAAIPAPAGSSPTVPAGAAVKPSSSRAAAP